MVKQNEMVGENDKRERSEMISMIKELSGKMTKIENDQTIKICEQSEQKTKMEKKRKNEN